MLILGGQWNGQLGKDLHARITSDNVAPGGLINGQVGMDPQTLQGLTLTMLIWGVSQWSSWKGSAKTLQGLPLTMLIQRGGWSIVSLERIHNDFGRITSDNVDLGGLMMVKLEMICEDIARITSDNVDLGVN